MMTTIMHQSYNILIPRTSLAVYDTSKGFKHFFPLNRSRKTWGIKSYKIDKILGTMP